MPRPLRILIAEDNPADAELVVHQLRREGFAPEWQRVDTEADFAAGLCPELDVILSDYDMPEFSGLRALEVLREHGLEIPFILISGNIGEETAVTAMKKGAADYLLKDRLARLGPAIEHALDQARFRRECQQADDELRATHAQLRQILEHSPAVIYALKLEGANVIPYLVSENITGLLGFTVAETLHHEWWLGHLHPADRDRAVASVAETLALGTSRTEYRLHHKDGSHRWVEDTRRRIRDGASQPAEMVGVLADITERKRAEEALRGISLQKSGRRKTTIRRDLWVMLGLTVLLFAAEYKLNIWEQAFIVLADQTKYPLMDEAVGSVVFLTFALMIFSYRRWKESVSEVVSQKHITEAFHVLHGELDERVQQRTAELARTNEALRSEIAARARAAEVLKESERRFREMLENVELIAMTLDRKGMVTFCNDYLLQTTGWTRKEVVGADWFAKLVPGQSELKEMFFSTVDGAGFPAHYENPIQKKNGELREIVWNNTMLRDGVGDIVGTASIGEDVTERRCAEERVREQAAMLDQAHEAIIVREIHTGRITFWNQGAERLYGWTAAEAAGREIGELICVEPDIQKAITRNLLETGEWHGERKHLSKTNKVRTVSSHATLVRDAKGQPKSALVINIDVTEQKSLQEQLLRTQRLEGIGTLASGVAHDLNNILSPILMSVPLLEDALAGSDAASLVSVIEQCAQRGTAIVRQVLTFARGVEGERMFVQVHHLLREMEKIAGQTFPRSITIRNRAPGNLWPVIGDATQLQQVVLNLCVNARDAMPAGGTLTLNGENVQIDESFAAMSPGAKPGPHLLVTVADTGEGIAPDVVEKIFDPFFTTKEVGKGTGLGLSTAMGIVKSHGGFLSVESAPGEGATFKVFLPADPEAAVAETLPEAAAPDGKGELILVVDDEASIRAVAETVLQARGYRVLLAADGPEALALFATHTEEIAALITDLAMPFIDGRTLIRALRKMKPDLRVIISSGRGEKAQVSEPAVEVFLSKPYGADTLLRALHAALAPRGE